MTVDNDTILSLFAILCSSLHAKMQYLKKRDRRDNKRMRPPDTDSSLRDWNSLDSDEQTAIRVEYGLFLDTLPPTCSLETKIERFRNWLREHKGIEYRD